MSHKVKPHIRAWLRLPKHRKTEATRIAVRDSYGFTRESCTAGHRVIIDWLNQVGMLRRRGDFGMARVLLENIRNARPDWKAFPMPIKRKYRKNKQEPSNASSPFKQC